MRSRGLRIETSDQSWTIDLLFSLSLIWLFGKNIFTSSSDERNIVLLIRILWKYWRDRRLIRFILSTATCKTVSSRTSFNYYYSISIISLETARSFIINLSISWNIHASFAYLMLGIFAYIVLYKIDRIKMISFSLEKNIHIKKKK